MIVLLGASGYIGSALAKELTARGLPFRPVSRPDLDYTRFPVFLEFLRRAKPEFVINAAGFTGRPNVDACEIAKAETLSGNTLLPQTIAQACAATDTPWGHVSSGCIFRGAKLSRPDGSWHVEEDLTQPKVQDLIRKSPGALAGFSETDEPNFTFRRPPCSFYSGSKALAEEALAGMPQTYIWRLRIPFDEFDNARNYLSKLQRYARIYDNVNSLSHRGDFARAVLDLWQQGAPFGTYNLTNPGFVTAREVAGQIQEILKPKREFLFWASDEEFYRTAAATPRSNCVLDVSKLLAAGIKMRPVGDAIESALSQWRREP